MCVGDRRNFVLHSYKLLPEFAAFSKERDGWNPFRYSPGLAVMQLEISMKPVCRQWDSLNIYRVSQEERSVFWKVIVSVILSKKIVYVHVSYSERFPR
jgi:hypothetical protein